MIKCGIIYSDQWKEKVDGDSENTRKRDYIRAVL